MAHIVRETSSYGNRLGNALKGIGIGFLLLVGATILLFWNEGNFVKTRKALDEAQNVLVDVESVDELDSSLNGKLIHASALADTDEILSDAEFGVSEKAISLKRSVEYYQWVENVKTETRDKLGGGQEKIKTYTYNRKWNSSPVNSAAFADPEYQDKNWVWLPLEPETQYAGKVAFGAYTLPDFMVRGIKGEEPANADPSAEQMADWQAQIAAHPKAPIPAGNTNASLVHVRDNTVYFGSTPASAQVGDIRVTFTRILPHEVSVIGKVQGSTFDRYVARNGKMVSRIEDGVVSSDVMFAHAQSENKTLMWILRIVGIVLVCAGIRMIFAILEAIARVVPMFGSIIGAGVTFVSAVLGIAWSLVWIAVAWIFYRPVLGVILLILAGACIYLLKTKGAKAAAVKVDAAPPA